jgi:hypothetical protein
VTFRNQLAPWAGPILEVLTRLFYPFILLSEVMFRRLRVCEIITDATIHCAARSCNSSRRDRNSA